MVSTTTGKGAGEVQWHRSRGARAAADDRWFTGRGGRGHAPEERPSFLELLLPLVALALGSVLTIGLLAVAALSLLSLLF